MRTHHPRTVPARPAARATVARATVAALAVALVVLVSGCGGSKSRWYGADGKPAAGKPAAEPTKPPAVQIAFTTPTDGATNVPPAVEIAYTSDGASNTIELAEASGAKVEGAMRPDKSSWVPAQQLKWSTQYTATVTGTTADGKTASKSTTFTTMAKPGNTTKASTVIADGQVVGVAMPIIVSFSSEIPKDQRAAVQKRLFVTTVPAQDGIWYWWNNKEVHYRSKEYWQTGTKLSVRAAIGGLPLGGNRYGGQDLTIRATVGSKTVLVADNATKQMTVTKDGQVLRTIPVSFGKPGTPSFSGNFVVMIKNQEETFDSATIGVPSESPDAYRLQVKWTQRLTWSGQYIHSAPWSEGDQGKRNVSHGCTNVSAANAEWLFNLTKVGDPVIIKGTEEHVAWQNGWTHWDRSWSEYVKGSAVPHAPPAPAAAPSAAPSTTN